MHCVLYISLGRKQIESVPEHLQDQHYDLVVSKTKVALEEDQVVEDVVGDPFQLYALIAILELIVRLHVRFSRLF